MRKDEVLLPPSRRCFAGAYRACVSRLGQAFEHGLDLQMTTGLRCHVKRFNTLVIKRGRAQVALHL